MELVNAAIINLTGEFGWSAVKFKRQLCAILKSLQPLHRIPLNHSLVFNIHLLLRNVKLGLREFMNEDNMESLLPVVVFLVLLWSEVDKMNYSVLQVARHMNVQDPILFQRVLVNFSIRFSDEIISTFTSSSAFVDLLQWAVFVAEYSIH
jgi:hypothetical protein